MSRGTWCRLSILAVSALMVVTAGSGVNIGTADAQPALRTIEGTVKNGTVGGEDVSGHPVMLHRVGLSRMEDVSTITDGYGAFRFDEVEYDPDLRYGVSVRYQDAIYGTDSGPLRWLTGPHRTDRLRSHARRHDRLRGVRLPSAGVCRRLRPDAWRTRNHQAGQSLRQGIRPGIRRHGTAQIRSAAGRDRPDNGHVPDRRRLRAGR